MKHIFKLMMPALVVFAVAACGGQYDDIADYATKETVYPAGYEAPVVRAGLERLEIDLFPSLKDKNGNYLRPKSKDIYLGKAKRTIVEYEGKTVPFDSVCSWLNITGLTESKVYTFKIYTEDENYNRSLSVTAFGTPYTSAERATLVAPQPMVLPTPYTAELNWQNGLSSGVVNIIGMEYSYIDADGAAVRQTADPESTRLNITNLTENGTTRVAIKYNVVPLLFSERILDDFPLYDTVAVKTISAAAYLELRTRRQIRHIDYSTGEVTFKDNEDPHESYIDIRYMRNSGTSNTVRLEKDAEGKYVNKITLDDIKRGENYYPEMMYMYVPVGSVAEVPTAFERYPVPFVNYIEERVYTVSKSSYRDILSDGSTQSSEYQGQYNEGGSANRVNLSFERAENGKLHYRISDLFGGFYHPGRNYGDGYIMYGTIAFDGVSSFSMIYGSMDPWGYGFEKVEGSYNESSNSITLHVYWSGYIFNLFLE
ncbi:MAG: hypothetical protein LBD59_06585 [Prevotellaceae bacterium]|jgi:hypothetical protein|nr:hypothetical protein [Prevotellaceae bacterium]